jgi:hypothetical protein
MKKILLFSLICLMANTFVSAQCIPDPIYKDSTFGVYPKPYDKDKYPQGGINKSACIGKPFKFIFTAKIPDTTVISQFGFQIPAKIDSVKLDKNDPLTVEGLPKGLTYACDPPNCVFFPKKPACLYIYGTATAVNTAKDYELKIKTIGYINIGLGPITYPLSFPDKNIAPGSYTLKLEPNNSTTCFVTGAADQNENIVHISAYPNPTNDFTTISFYALDKDIFDFVVTDLTGKVVFKETRNVEQGINSIEFEVSNYPAGAYIYYLGNNKGKTTNRLIVNH